jgi:hypothetical protein
VDLFNWKGKPKSKPQASRGSVAAPDEISQAAQETEAASSSATASGVRVAEPDHGSDLFTITPDVAMAMVKGCFSPLARYDHSAWALTDEEAGPVVPKMQAAIQAVLDRHMPQFMMQMMNKYPEMLSLTYAMAMLYYMKFKAVRLLRVAEYREEQKRLAEARKVEAQAKAEKDKEWIYTPEAPGGDLPKEWIYAPGAPGGDLPIGGQALPMEHPPEAI